MFPIAENSPELLRKHYTPGGKAKQQFDHALHGFTRLHLTYCQFTSLNRGRGILAWCVLQAVYCGSTHVIVVPWLRWEYGPFRGCHVLPRAQPEKVHDTRGWVILPTQTWHSWIINLVNRQCE